MSTGSVVGGFRKSVSRSFLHFSGKEDAPSISRIGSPLLSFVYENALKISGGLAFSRNEF